MMKLCLLLSPPLLAKLFGNCSPDLNVWGPAAVQDAPSLLCCHCCTRRGMNLAHALALWGLHSTLHDAIQAEALLSLPVGDFGAVLTRAGLSGWRCSGIAPRTAFAFPAVFWEGCGPAGSPGKSHPSPGIPVKLSFYK